MRRRIVSIVLVCLLAGAGLSRAAITEVTAEGRAAGDVANARELALTDALREAVRKGVGVDLLSSSEVKDFALDYDRIFAASFGYVREYTVMKSWMGDDGIYRVQVRAKVGEGQPGMKDLLALRQIVHLKQSPRVALEVDELIEGVPPGSDFCKAWFEQAARDMQLQLVDVKRTTRQSDRLATRDEVFGDQATAKVRRAGIAQDADFIIQAKVRGSYVGKPPYGMLGHTFALSVDLRALRPDSAQVVSAVAVPTREVVSSIETTDGAARDGVHRLMAGDAKQPGAGAEIFRRVFANWITELDLGAIIRLELAQVSDPEHDRLIQTLRETEQITAVWPREFDSKGLTAVDVESRLDASGLKASVLKALGGGFEFDHGTGHYLQFRRGTVPSVNRVGTDSAQTVQTYAPAGQTGPSQSMPSWVWALIGSGAVLLVGGAFWLGRRGR